MAKNYGRGQAMRRKGGFSKQLVIAFMGFLSGYLGASVFDLTSLSHWVNTQLLSKYTGQVIPKPATVDVVLPKPKFEFYTLLANQHAPTTEPEATVVPAITTSSPSTEPAASVGEPVAKKSPTSTLVPLKNTTVAVDTHTPKPSVAAELPATPSVATLAKNAYVVQVGSFKRQSEAERIKASLSLKGFMVSVVTVNQQGMRWYRVVIGPFASRPLAEKAQSSVARTEHIIGMIRKMDA